MQGFGIVETFRELWLYRSMLVLFVKRSLRMRYKNSKVGMLWSAVFPFVQVFVISLVIGRVLGSGPSNLSAFMMCAFLPWMFFNTAVLDASSSILGHMPMIQKVYIPREILPLSTVLANLIHMMIALVVFLVYRYVFTTAAFGWPGLPPKEVLLLPVLILIQTMFICGLSLVLCVWTTFYEDVKYLIQVTLSIYFYSLPIMYFAENIFFSPRIPEAWRYKLYHLYLLMPMTWNVVAFKQAFFERQNIAGPNQPMTISAPFDYRLLAYSAAMSLVMLLVGMAYFNKMKWKFTERP